MTSVPSVKPKQASSTLMTQRKIDRKIKSGRGSGVKGTYQPWIKVWDIASKGVSHLLQGVKCHRTHHLLSNAERDYHLILEQDPSVIDIREQFPLFSQAETQAIASSLGYQHPVYPGTDVPVVMTTDFLITTIDSDGNEKLVARSVKYLKEFEDADTDVQNRMAEKLKIEQRYWALRGVDWKLVLHENLSPIKTANLIILRTYANIEPSLPTDNNVDNLVAYIARHDTTLLPLRILLEKASRAIFIEYKGVKRLFHYLLWTGKLRMDLTAKVINLSEPLQVWVGETLHPISAPIEETRHA